MLRGEQGTQLSNLGSPPNSPSSFDWPAPSLGQPVRSLLPRRSFPQTRRRLRRHCCCRASKAALQSSFGGLNPSQMLPWGLKDESGWVGGPGLHPSYTAWRQGADTCLPSSPQPAFALLPSAPPCWADLIQSNRWWDRQVPSCPS